MKRQLNENIFNRWQKLAGLINESEMNEEASAEQSVQKAMPYVSKIENNPMLDKAAEKIANDPTLLSQLQKILSQNGVPVNLNESTEELDSNDMKTLMLSLAKHSTQANEGMSNDDNKDDSTAPYSILSFIGGGFIGTALSKIVIGAIPASASIFNGPGFIGSVAGVALFLLARKVYLLANPDK
jgi:septum formation inhibitor MinC